MTSFWLELFTLGASAGLFFWARRLEGLGLLSLVTPVRTSATVLLTLVMLRLLVIEPFEGVGPSMMPTFAEHSKVLVDKSAYGWRLPGGLWVWRRASPSPGQVVVLEGQNAHNHRELLLKRVVAVGGDEVRIEGERIFVNGQALEAAPEPLPQGASASLVPWSAQVVGHAHRVFLKAGFHADSSEVVTWKIHPGYVFVVGDNRAASYDSRDFGPIARDKVVGRVIGVWRNGHLSAVDGALEP